jgi:phospholipid/cholesterol/gamma-HCH transport system ATP-binding protein
MSETLPVLELIGALPEPEASALPNSPLALRLLPGACALVDTQDAERTRDLADLCSGLAALRDGEARFMGFNWRRLGDERAAALRGRIGRTYGRGAWIVSLPTSLNVMRAQLHHTRAAQDALTDAAEGLARQLGLPGLPTVRPDRLSAGDLVRAGCVRAFLGEPRLLLLETSISAGQPALTTPLLDLLARALHRGAAALCFTRDAPFWLAQGFPVDHRLELLEDGLAPVEAV